MMWVVLLLAALAAGISGQNLKPKCLLMKEDWNQAKKEGSPEKSALLSSIYDPECESDGKFKAKQCNNSEECRCVNCAGILGMGKGDKSLECEKLVETQQVRLVLTHKPVDGIVDKSRLRDVFHKRYNNMSKDIDQMLSVEYYPENLKIALDVQKGDEKSDLTALAYYIERDVRLTLQKFELTVGNIKLEDIKLQDIKVNCMDDRKHPSRTTIVIILVLVLLITVVVCVVTCCLARRRSRQRRSRATGP